MMRLLLIIILMLSFQSWTKADDIRDFEIEGVSIGDSLLDHHNKSVLDDIEKYFYPKSKKIVGLYSEIFNKNLIKYDAIQFSVTPDNYQIEAIAGLNYDFENKRLECYQEMDQIFIELESLFPNSKIYKEKESPHEGDSSGKSIGKFYEISLTNGFVRISCTDWSKEIDLFDSLKISIHSKKHIDWINDEAY